MPRQLQAPNRPLRYEKNYYVQQGVHNPDAKKKLFEVDVRMRYPLHPLGMHRIVCEYDAENCHEKVSPDNPTEGVKQCVKRLVDCEEATIK